MNYLLIIPLITAALAIAATFSARSSALNQYAPIFTGAITFITGLYLVATLHRTNISFGGVLRVDPLSAWMLMTVGAVGLVALGSGLRGGIDRGYSSLLNCFLAAMSLAVEADNIGVMWFAIEATTVATAYLVSMSGTKKSAEAAWKYVVIASSGIAIALLGVVIIFGASKGTTISWISLMRDHGLNQGLLRLGLSLSVLGFATKVGLFPMHSWLPDAHSQSPAPVSALMSGVLLSVALYLIVRMRLISEISLANTEIKGLLIAIGVGSIGVASLLMVRQSDIKRLLAYSSMEHMGVMAIGVAIGKDALPAVMTYILAHGLIKASLFVLAGRLVSKTGTSDISELAKSHNITGATKYLMILGLIGLLGLPPFAIFLAEVSISINGFTHGMAIFIVLSFIFALVAFSSVVRSTVQLAFGNGPDDYPSIALGIDQSLINDSITKSGSEVPSYVKTSTSKVESKQSRPSRIRIADLTVATALIAALVFPLLDASSQRAIEATLSALTGGAR
ncbi:MAG: proton-conducting transporter membrane subunit [Actinomycetota bacterium]|nr:proton-conducting transporter membrane subunit [Actinomycetota bacterium]